MKPFPRIKSLYLCNKTIEIGLIFLVVFTAFSFGAVEVWAYSLMEIVIFLLSLVWLIKIFIHKNLGHNSSLLRSPQKDDNNKNTPSEYSKNFSRFFSIPIVLFFLLILFQLIPFPPKIIKFISPNTYELYALTLPDYDQNPGSKLTGELEDQPHESEWATRAVNGNHPLAINPYATKTILLRISAYIILFFLIVHNFTFNKPKNREDRYNFGERSRDHSKQRSENGDFLIPGNRLVNIIIITGFLVALLGILQQLTNTSKLFWVLEMPSSARPFATFVNRNNFAGYINMIIPIAIATLISQQSFLYATKKHYRRPVAAVIKRLIVQLDPWIRKNGLYLFAPITMISALIFSGSRGGILSFGGALGVFFLLTKFGARGQNSRLKGLSPIVIILAVILVAILWSNPNLSLNRFSTLSNFERYIEIASRVQAYHATLDMIRDFPLLGAGLGSFANLYYRYRGERLANSIYVAAHSDYLQLLVETGFIGFGFIFLLISLYIYFVVTRYSREKRFPQRLLSTGMIAGMFTMMCHSLIGFNIQIPANAFLFSEILGFTYILLQKQ